MFNLSKLSTDVIQAIGSYFGLDEVVGDLVGDKENTKAAKEARKKLNAKLEQLRRDDESEYTRLLNSFGIVQKSQAFGGSNSRKTLSESGWRRDKIAQRTAEVTDLVNQIESDLANPKASARFKYSPKYDKVHSKKGENPFSKISTDDYDKERDDISKRIENAIG